MVGRVLAMGGRGTKTVFQHHEVPENSEARTGRASLGRGNLS